MMHYNEMTDHDLEYAAADMLNDEALAHLTKIRQYDPTDNEMMTWGFFELLRASRVTFIALTDGFGAPYHDLGQRLELQPVLAQQRSSGEDFIERVKERLKWRAELVTIAQALGGTVNIEQDGE